MFKNKFNLNGIDYKVVDGLVYTYSKGTLDPCYRGDSRILDEFCRTHDLTLYVRPKGLHAYGHQSDQRGKTAKLVSQPSAHSVPVDGSLDIKKILIDLATDDKLPLDLNDLDASIFNPVFKAIERVGKNFDDIPVYYQPELKDVEWGELLYSFEVYHSLERAQKDFPGKKIIRYQGEDIEEPTYVDLD